jgi:excisionase family DNA binding protein
MSSAYDSQPGWAPDGMALAVLRALERLEARLTAVESLMARLVEERDYDWPAAGDALTAAAAAEVLGSSVRFVYDRFHSRELPGHWLGSDIRIHRRGLAEWLRANSNRPRPAAASDEGAVAAGDEDEKAAATPDNATAPRPARPGRRGRRPWDRHPSVTEKKAA